MTRSWSATMSRSGNNWRADRRQFLSAALVGLTPKSERRIEGRIIDDSHLWGHRLRDRRLEIRPLRRQRISVVIVGAGIAGLSAGRRLLKRGFRDFLILEMERSPGGNSRWGENAVSAFPWGAHYLPVPNRNAKLVVELCREFGLLDAGGFNERHLCHSPQQRLFIHGKWQLGLEPVVGVSPAHESQFRRFEQRMLEFAATGQFTIPMEQGARKSPLDAMSMQQWMQSEGFDSPYLQWYVDYACRDDYGARARDVSAWAGIHYFASREHSETGPFTWPEGNGWLVKRFLETLSPYMRTEAPVAAIRRGARKLAILAADTEYLAEAVIWAAPTFLLRYVCEEAPDASGLVYSPWLVANLTLDRLPRHDDSPPAWDNVIYDSPALGYVVATHQSLRTHHDRTVWTWYYALADSTPAAARRLLLEKDWAWWKEFILRDLERPHPDIRRCVARIDLMRFGHAMARPAPRTIWSPARLRLLGWGSDIVLANSDLSSFSIFEEALYRGARAADRVLDRLGRSSR